MPNYVFVNPGESIQTAINSIDQTGGTVELATGTWTENIIINKNNLTLKGAGITNSTLNVSSGYAIDIRKLPISLDNLFSNITIQDLHIKGGFSCIYLFNTKDISLNNVHIENSSVSGIIIGFSTRINITNIKMNNTGSTTGIAHGNSSYMLFQNNVIQTPSLYGIANNGGLVPDYSVTNAQIARDTLGLNSHETGNIIDRCDISGTNLFAIQKYSMPNQDVVKNCHIHNNSGHGILYAFAINCIAENNIIHDNAWSGITISEESVRIPSYTQNITIRNNIIYGMNLSNSIYGRGIDIYNNYGTNGFGGIKIYNNTLYNCKEWGIRTVNLINLNDNIVKNNISINCGYGIKNDSGDNVIISYNNAWNNPLGNFYGTNSIGNIQLDPLFADKINNDFHLKSTGGRWTPTGWVNDLVMSSSIGTGDPTSDNSISPWGGIIEMGAYGNTLESSNNQIECPIPICIFNITQI